MAEEPIEGAPLTISARRANSLANGIGLFHAIDERGVLARSEAFEAVSRRHALPAGADEAWVRGYASFAASLGLIAPGTANGGRVWRLTAQGEAFLAARDESRPFVVSTAQVELLRAMLALRAEGPGRMDWVPAALHVAAAAGRVSAGAVADALAAEVERGSFRRLVDASRLVALYTDIGWIDGDGRLTYTGRSAIGLGGRAALAAGHVDSTSATGWASPGSSAAAPAGGSGDDRPDLAATATARSAPELRLVEGYERPQPSAAVRRLEDGDGDRPRIWWVNVGLSYRAALEQGVLWAPARDRAGRAQPSWATLREMGRGDHVLCYLRGKLRAVGQVRAAAVASSRPDGFPTRAGVPDDGAGLAVAVDFAELAAAIPLDEIELGWRLQERGPFNARGAVRQGYAFALSDGFAVRLTDRFAALGAGAPALASGYRQPSLEEVQRRLDGDGLRIDGRLLRRYALSLDMRGFVILAGVSGSGKTWLAEQYAAAIGARSLLVAVAPNWTANEDLLGYLDPLAGDYRETAFSSFVRAAAQEHAAAVEQGRAARPFHVVLDEMNLARVEHYFAKVLSALEPRARNGTAALELAPGIVAELPPNLVFVGTVNVDETTHGFADKVYDRAQVIEVEIDRAQLDAHVGDVPYRELLMAIWEALHDVAPFGFRAVEEIGRYVTLAARHDVAWEPAFDEQLVQKLLPKVAGTDARVRAGLEKFAQLTAGLPLSSAKAGEMIAMLDAHGFATYHR